MSESEVEIHRGSKFGFTKTYQAEEGRETLIFNSYYFLGVLIELRYLLLKI